MIKKLNLTGSGNYLPEEEAEELIRKGMRHSAFVFLNEKYSNRKEENEYFSKLMDRWEQEDKSESAARIPDEARNIYIEALHQQREWLLEENKNNLKIDEELVRHYLLKLDLEEERLRIG